MDFPYHSPISPLGPLDAFVPGKPAVPFCPLSPLSNETNHCCLNNYVSKITDVLDTFQFKLITYLMDLYILCFLSFPFHHHLQLDLYVQDYLLVLGARWDVFLTLRHVRRCFDIHHHIFPSDALYVAPIKHIANLNYMNISSCRMRYATEYID